MRYTEQTAFNAIYEHAKLQKVSIGVSGICKYRGPDNNKCFVGVLIPDDKYDPSYDRGETLVGVKRQVDELNDLSYDFLSDIRNIHDNHDPIVWQMRLIDLAKIYNLTVPS